MVIHLNFWPTLAFAVVLLSWFVFVILFLARKKPPTAPESKRDRASIIGIVLQGFSYGIVWSVRRQWFTPIFSVSNAVERSEEHTSELQSRVDLVCRLL